MHVELISRLTCGFSRALARLSTCAWLPVSPVLLGDMQSCVYDYNSEASCLDSSSIYIIKWRVFSQVTLSSPVQDYPIHLYCSLISIQVFMIIIQRGFMLIRLVYNIVHGFQAGRIIFICAWLSNSPVLLGDYIQVYVIITQRSVMSLSLSI